LVVSIAPLAIVEKSPTHPGVVRAGWITPQARWNR